MVDVLFTEHAHGSSFQKKIILLFGDGDGDATAEKPNGSHQGGGGPTQRASALAALNSAFKSTSSPKASSASWPGGISQGSQRAAAVAALSSVLTAETKKSPDVSPARPSRSPPAEASRCVSLKSEDSAETEDCKKVLEVEETETSEPIIESNGGESGSITDADQDENAYETSQSTFSYERLKAKSDNPVMIIDYKRRKAYLSDGEFQSMFEMTKDAFYKLPKWKQDMLKRKVDLF